MLEKYKSGFTIYADSDKRRQCPDYFILDKRYSTETELYFLAYDADLWPAPNIDTWLPDYIKEVCGKICDKLQDFEGTVYLDGIKLDRENRKLKEEGK